MNRDNTQSATPSPEGRKESTIDNELLMADDISCFRSENHNDGWAADEMMSQLEQFYSGNNSDKQASDSDSAEESHADSEQWLKKLQHAQEDSEQRLKELQLRKDDEAEDGPDLSIVQQIDRCSGQPTPQLVWKKVLFKECAVAGVSFHLKYDDELWDELEVGTKVALVREKKNMFDKNAVAVALADDFDGDPDNFDFDFILGYIPKSENEQIAQLLDMGWGNVFVAELSTVRKKGNINNRLRISVYIQSKEPELVVPDPLRAESLSSAKLSRMTRQLREQGVAYFRFRIDPDGQWVLPEEGDKIVMVHCQTDSEILYLMRVLAKDDDCLDYLDDYDTVIAKDDCVPYILTNVMGPIRIKRAGYPFLKGLDLKGFSAHDCLPAEVSLGFKRLFDNQ